MATTLSFSKTAIENLPIPESGRNEYHDSKIPALHLRVSASGVKTFSVFKRVKGQGPERITLGRFPDLSVENARKNASIVLASIASGANPAEAKRAHKGELTFKELFNLYLTRHARVHKATADEDQQRYDQYLSKPLGQKRLSSVTKISVEAIHSSITATGHPVVANRVLALISTVFGRAIEWNLATNNPAKGIRRNPEKSRDRFIQTGEMETFFAAVMEDPSETVRDYLLISLLTGARRSNVLSMRWKDLSLEEGIWHIPTTKNGTPQHIPLVQDAQEILRRRSFEASGTEFVFPGTGKTGHFVEPRKGWERIHARAAAIRLHARLISILKPSEANRFRSLRISNPKTALQEMITYAEKQQVPTSDIQLEDLKIHDLRRTFGSYQAKAGSSTAIIGKSLNHKSQQATAIYARLDLDPVRESVQKGTNSILAAAGLGQASKARKNLAEESD